MNKFFFSQFKSFAHELGHNIGLSHDGLEGNKCLESDSYIMTPTSLFSNILKSFRFSPCSILQLKSTLLNSDFK